MVRPQDLSLADSDSDEDSEVEVIVTDKQVKVEPKEDPPPETPCLGENPVELGDTRSMWANQVNL